MAQSVMLSVLDFCNLCIKKFNVLLFNIGWNFILFAILHKNIFFNGSIPTILLEYSIRRLEEKKTFKEKN